MTEYEERQMRRKDQNIAFQRQLLVRVSERGIKAWFRRREALIEVRAYVVAHNILENTEDI